MHLMFSLTSMLSQFPSCVWTLQAIILISKLSITGVFSVQYSIATPMTNWAQIVHRFVIWCIFWVLEYWSSNHKLSSTLKLWLTQPTPGNINNKLTNTQTIETWALQQNKALAAQQNSWQSHCFQFLFIS